MAAEEPDSNDGKERRLASRQLRLSCAAITAERNQAPRLRVGGKRSRPMQEEEIEKYVSRARQDISVPSGIDWAKDLGDGIRRMRKPILAGRPWRSRRPRRNLIGGANKEDYHFKNLTPGKELSSHGLRRPAQRHRWRGLPELRRAACASIPRSRSGTSSSWATSIQNPWAHGPRPQRQGSRADHGQLWDWHRAHFDCRGRAEQRRKRILAAAFDRAF